MHFAEVMALVARGFEAIGAAVLVIGLFWSFGLALLVWRRTSDGNAAYQALRRSFGGVLLLGLEILVAADLVRTLAVEPTWVDGVARDHKDGDGLLVEKRKRGGPALAKGPPPRRRNNSPGSQIRPPTGT